jgi:hypothetical protein
MNSTLNGPEYNALLHAIWRLQRDIKSGEYTGKTLSVIERDRPQYWVVSDYEEWGE